MFAKQAAVIGSLFLFVEVTFPVTAIKSASTAVPAPNQLKIVRLSSM